MPESLPTGPQLPASEAPTMPPHSADKSQTLGDSSQFEFDKIAPDLPGYEILGELGRGGMGVVYKARHVKLNRIVALKMILAGNYASQADLVRFLAEAEAVAALQHPNIVQIFEIGQHDGLPFFTLEYVDGGTLTDKVRDHPLPAGEAAALVEQVARGIQFAHAKGLVHRDLKPDNVLLTSDGTPKVTDFGLVKRVEKGSDLTQSGAIVGTPSYMAPEQADRKGKTVGPAADVYALGAILYRLIAGRPPFHASTPLDTVLQVVSDDPVPPSHLQSMTPKDLETICLKCLRKEPEKRYACVRALADDLNRFLRGEPIQARPVGTIERGWKWVKRNPVVTALLAAVIVTLITGTLVSYLKYRDANNQRRRAEEALNAEADQRRIAETAQKQAMDALRATSDDAVTELIGSKPVLGPKEKKFIETILKRWQAFAAEKGDGELARHIRAEGTYRVAVLRARLGQLEEAAAGYRESLSLYARLSSDFPAAIEYRQGMRDNYNNLGLLQGRLGKNSEAEDSIRQSLKIAEGLAAEFPSNAGYRHQVAQGWINLGYRLHLVQKLREAEAPYREAKNILSDLVVESPAEAKYRGDLAKVQFNLGALYLGMGRPIEAEASLRQALPELTKLVDEHPGTSEYRQDLAATHAHLADLLESLGRLQEAETASRKSVVITKDLAADFPAMPEYQNEWVKSTINLVQLLNTLGKSSETEALYGNLLETMQKLADEHPAVPDYRYQLALAGVKRAILLADLGKVSEGELAFRRVLSVLEKLDAEFPDDPKYGRFLGGCRCDLANLLRRSKRSDQSLDGFGQAIAALEEVLRRFPDDAQARQFLLNAHSGRALALEDLKRYEEAIVDWTKALDLSGKGDRPSLRISRARAWAKAGMLERATTEADDAAKGATPHIVYGAACVFALAHGQSGDDRSAARAVELLRQAVALGLKGAAYIKQNPDFKSLRDHDDFKRFVADFEKKSTPMPQRPSTPRSDKR